MKNKMNKFALVGFLSLLTIFNACHEENSIFYDDTPPDPPTNLFVLAGDTPHDNSKIVPYLLTYRTNAAGTDQRSFYSSCPGGEATGLWSIDSSMST